VIYTTSQPVGLVAQLLSVYGLNIFLLLRMSTGWLQDCTSGWLINVAAEQTGGMTDLRFNSGHTEQCCDRNLVVILQHSVVLWLRGISINWLEMLKINLLPKWSGQKNKPFCCYLQIRQAGSSVTSLCIYQYHSVFWQKIAVFIRTWDVVRHPLEFMQHPRIDLIPPTVSPPI